MPCFAKQGKAKQLKAMQSKAKQHDAKTTLVILKGIRCFTVDVTCNFDDMDFITAIISLSKLRRNAFG